MSTIDLSLTNSDLYQGCEIETVAGRLNLRTPVEQAIEIIGKNIANTNVDPDEVTLTGPMAVWSYLIIFHSVVHRTRRVLYDDGRGNRVLIAAHG